MEGGRVPPNSLDAERSVLGCMMQDRMAVSLAQELLGEHDFYTPAHQAIFAAMLQLSMAGQPVDLVTLSDALRRSGQLAGVGDITYLVELSRFVPSTANARAYIHIVEEKSTLRKLIAASADISQKSYTAEMEVPDILNEAEKAIYDVTMRRGSEVFQPVYPVLLKSYERIEHLNRMRGAIDGVPTGYVMLDQLLTGLHPGEMVLIAGRPSMGKTSLGMNIAEHAAIHAGRTVAVFSLEMPAEQLVMRMLCSQARVDMQSVRRGLLTGDDWMRLADAMGLVAQAKLFIDATAGLTVVEMRSRARRLKIEHGLDLIVIDYLQLMAGSGKSHNRQEEVSDISRGLKGLAQELGVPVIALSQLSRAPQGRSNHRPVLSDIRDSGAIEQDADVVMFIHREAYYAQAGQQGEAPEQDFSNVAEIIIAKQRNGPLGTVLMAWQGEFTKFLNLSPKDYEEYTKNSPGMYYSSGSTQSGQ